MTRLILSAILLVAVSFLTAFPAEAPGCAAVPPLDERVTVSNEAALIIWDEATKTEHFIRRAAFEATSYDFGFLVPTPTRPDLELVDESMFGELTRLTAPKTVYETREIKEEIDFGCAKAKMGSNDTALASGEGKAAVRGVFQVLEQKRLGDLDTAILAFRPGEGDPAIAATDLLDWLSKHGYTVRPDLKDWITIYARQKWIITAFKIAGKPPTPQTPDSTTPSEGKKDIKKEPGHPRGPVNLTVTAIRMSFQTDRPFFPYREPVGERGKQDERTSRLLKVFVAAKQRMAGKLGDGSQAWPGQTVWADAIPEQTRGSLLTQAKLPAATSPGGWWLTEFEDHSSPRPGIDEVYFEPSADPSAVARPPNVITRYVRVRVYPEWVMALVIGLPFLLLVGGLIVARRLRK